MPQRKGEPGEADELARQQQLGDIEIEPVSRRPKAVEADEFLTKRGLILRRVAGYGLPNALRMTIGTEEGNRQVIAALKDFMA